jgi:hypothetical protein
MQSQCTERLAQMRSVTGGQARHHHNLFIPAEELTNFS